MDALRAADQDFWSAVARILRARGAMARRSSKLESASGSPERRRARAKRSRRSSPATAGMCLSRLRSKTSKSARSSRCSCDSLRECKCAMARGPSMPVLLSNPATQTCPSAHP
eukprot:13603432-Alexandrium_andersonii.AAC.1